MPSKDWGWETFEYGNYWVGNADIYFDQIPPNEEICLKVQGYGSHKVAENEPVLVQIYDYYDSCKYQSRHFYKYFKRHAKLIRLYSLAL